MLARTNAFVLYLVDRHDLRPLRSRVSTEVAAVDGVVAADVDLDASSSVFMGTELTPARIVAAIDEAGYEAQADERPEASSGLRSSCSRSFGISGRLW